MNNVKKIYRLDECITFCKTKEEFCGLSNMAAGFPIKLQDIDIRTSEALYQVCRFPDYPAIQREIIQQKSPMSAKVVARSYNHFTREDWETVRVQIMNWCVHVKLLNN